MSALLPYMITQSEILTFIEVIFVQRGILVMHIAVVGPMDFQEMQDHCERTAVDDEFTTVVDNLELFGSVSRIEAILEQL